MRFVASVMSNNVFIDEIYFLSGGDYIFEVTLFKGTYGLGMNLVGGGSADSTSLFFTLSCRKTNYFIGQQMVGNVLIRYLRFMLIE